VLGKSRDRYRPPISDRSFASPYFPATDVWSSRLPWLNHGDRPRRLRLDNWLALCQRRLRRRQRSRPACQDQPVRRLSRKDRRCIAGCDAWRRRSSSKSRPNFRSAWKFMHIPIRRAEAPISTDRRSFRERRRAMGLDCEATASWLGSTYRFLADDAGGAKPECSNCVSRAAPGQGNPRHSRDLLVALSASTT